MARLNASANDRFTRQLQRRWEREQQAKRIIEPEPEETVASVAVDLQAPIDELPEDDPRRIMFDSIGKAMDEMAGITDLPMPKFITNSNIPPGKMYWLSSDGFKLLDDNDPPVETTVYIDGKEVATVKRESMFGGKAIEFAEDQAVKPRLASYSLLEQLREQFKFESTSGQPVFEFRSLYYPETATQAKIAEETARSQQQAVLDTINEITRSAMRDVWLGTYCKANCGERTKNQSGYCTTCLDRMAFLGRSPQPQRTTDIVPLRPKRQLQLED